VKAGRHAYRETRLRLFEVFLVLSHRFVGDLQESLTGQDTVVGLLGVEDHCLAGGIQVGAARRDGGNRGTDRVERAAKVEQQLAHAEIGGVKVKQLGGDTLLLSGLYPTDRSRDSLLLARVII